MPDENDQSLTAILGQITSLVQRTDWTKYYSREEDLTAEIGQYGAAMLCALVAGDEKLATEEAALINQFTGTNGDHNGAQTWVTSNQDQSFQVLSSTPKFFKALSEYDSEHRTDFLNGCLGLLTCYALKIVSDEDQLSNTEFRTVSNLVGIPAGQAEPKRFNFKLPPDVAPANGVSSVAPLANKNELTKDLNRILEELDSLVGLDEVKSDVKGMINLIKVRKMREERGIKSPPLTLHLVFSGNPGTGKTTVARLLGDIYRTLGVLSKGHLVEVDRSGLVAGYVGQTAIKVRDVVAKAEGGILFIDEAYSLSSRSDQDFGREAIETLLKAMEDRRSDFVVIVAGYTEKMQEFLQSNPGLRSRFNKFVQFHDYSSEQLARIFSHICRTNGYEFTPVFEQAVRPLFAIDADMRNKGFANARAVRNIFERLVSNHANRVADNPAPTDQELVTFDVQDLAGIAKLV